MVKMKASEFQKKIKTGEIVIGKKGRMSFGKLDPAYKSLLNKMSDETGKKKRKVKKREEYLTEDDIQNTINVYYRRGSIYIPYNVCSSKNSRKIIRPKGLNHPITTHSDAYKKYVKLSSEYWKQNRLLFLDLIKDLEKPYLIRVDFIRFNDDRFDYHNMEQGPADLMQEFGWIEDDDKKNLKIIPGGCMVDKQKQGMLITPLKNYSEAESNIFI